MTSPPQSHVVPNVPDNVTMGQIQSPVFESKKMSSILERVLRHWVFPRYIPLCLALCVVFNPALCVLVIYAYAMARRSYSQGKFRLAKKYMNMVFILGIIGITITFVTSIFGSVYIYIESTKESKLVVGDNDARMNTSQRFIASLHGRKELERIVKTLNETKTDWSKVSSIENAEVIQIMVEENNYAELKNGTQSVGNVTVMDFQKFVINHDRRIATQTQIEGDGCRALQTFIKENTMKMQVRVKHKVSGWKYYILKINKNVNCVDSV